jgi:molecular chaperone GrpE (heat shock protein)
MADMNNTGQQPQMSDSSNQNKGSVRKHASDSDSDLSPKPPQAKKPNIEDSKLLKAIQSLERKVDTSIADQQNFRKSFETRLQNLEKNVNIKIEKESKGVKEEFQMEIVKLTDNIDTVNKKRVQFETEFYKNMTVLQNRVSVLEMDGPDFEAKIAEFTRESFHPDNTVVVTGIRYSQGEDIVQKAKSLIIDGLNLDVDVVNAARTPFREGKPGIVKIEFNSKAEKITVLRAKKTLANSEHYQRVYIRSSQTHTERLLQLNTKTILKELGAEEKYRLTGSGRLVLKANLGPEDRNKDDTRRQRDY